VILEQTPTPDNIVDMLLLLASKYGLYVGLRETSSLEWEQVLEQAAYVPVSYSQAMINYQGAYFGGLSKAWQDCSLVLFNDRKPCAVWPISVALNDSRWSISSAGDAVVGPLFSRHLSNKSVKSLVTACAGFLNAFAAQVGCDIRYQESFRDSDGLSEWYLRTVQEAPPKAVKHDLYIDLRPDLTSIRGHFRKSYKPLISSGEKLWQVAVSCKSEPSVWEEFRLLHLAVAGRETRTLQSWDAQLQAIAAQAAFLVYLRDPDGRMVGGGLFHITRDEGLYAVAAYDRALFDKPLGHVVQYHAILEMKKRQLRWYKLGSRVFQGDEPQPSPKELSIAEFKQGFASHVFPRIELHSACNQVES
jgi:FemAB family protein